MRLYLFIHFRNQLQIWLGLKPWFFSCVLESPEVWWVLIRGAKARSRTVEPPAKRISLGSFPHYPDPTKHHMKAKHMTCFALRDLEITLVSHLPPWQFRCKDQGKPQRKPDSLPLAVFLNAQLQQGTVCAHPCQIMAAHSACVVLNLEILASGLFPHMDFPPMHNIGALNSVLGNS